MVAMPLAAESGPFSPIPEINHLHVDPFLCHMFGTLIHYHFCQSGGMAQCSDYPISVITYVTKVAMETGDPSRFTAAPLPLAILLLRSLACE